MKPYIFCNLVTEKYIVIIFYLFSSSHTHIYERLHLYFIFTGPYMYAPAYISSPRVKFIYPTAMFTAVLVCSGPCGFFHYVTPSDTLRGFGDVS